MQSFYEACSCIMMGRGRVILLIDVKQTSDCDELNIVKSDLEKDYRGVSHRREVEIEIDL